GGADRAAVPHDGRGAERAVVSRRADVRPDDGPSFLVAPRARRIDVEARFRARDHGRGRRNHPLFPSGSMNRIAAVLLLVLSMPFRAADTAEAAKAAAWV